MSETKKSSTASKVATSQQMSRFGIGCAIVAVVVLIGIVWAATQYGPRLRDLAGVPAVTTVPTLNDDISPQRLAGRRGEELARLNSYGWVNEEGGVAHIPIDRAMALIAQQGLPVGAEIVHGEQEATPIADEPPALATATQAVDLTNLTYLDDVLPIFEEHCEECHGAEDPEEGLELTRYRTTIVGSMNGPVIEPGDAENSYLVDQVVSGKMPKRDDPLSQAEIDIIVAWIEAGAPEE